MECAEIELCRKLRIGHRVRLVMVAVIVVAAGCGDQRASVSGTVTLDGKPVEGSPELYGTVSFYRVGGGGAPAVGIIGKSGRYTLSIGSQQGIEPGQYMVGVSVKKILPPETPDGLTRPQQISPRQYAKPEQSGFRATVELGDNIFDFELKSDLDG